VLKYCFETIKTPLGLKLLSKDHENPVGVGNIVLRPFKPRGG